MEELNFRSRRSDDPTVATRLQLVQVAEDFGLENCVLVDEAGNVCSSASTVPSALGELTAQFPSLFDRGQRPKHRNLSACEFRAAGRRMFLVTVGQSNLRDVALYRAILGVRRILR